jgi:hypothetical protein
MRSKRRDPWSYNNCRRLIVGILEAIYQPRGVNIRIPGVTKTSGE